MKVLGRALGLVLSLALQLRVIAGAVGPTDPQTIDELVARAFPDGGAPQFVALPSTPQVAIANNDTATLKIMDLKISALPLRPGYTTFQLHHILEQDLPAKSEIELQWFAGGTNGSSTNPICPYLEFARLHCPLAAYKRDEVMQQVLQVPPVSDDGRVSFLAKITTPKNELVAHIAAVIDIVPGDGDDTSAAQNAGDQHNEL